MPRWRDPTFPDTDRAAGSGPGAAPGPERMAAPERAHEEQPTVPNRLRRRRSGPGLVRSVGLTPIRITVERIDPARPGLAGRPAGRPVRWVGPAGRPADGGAGAPARGPGFGDLAALEHIDRDVFRAWWTSPDAEAVHTGLIGVQAQLAATRTVAGGRPVHSLHAYFPHPAHGRASIVYLVDRVRDGGQSTTRRVTGVQDGEVVCVMSLLFGRGGQAGHQLKAPSAPPPLDLERVPVTASTVAAATVERLVDLRVVAAGTSRGVSRDGPPGAAPDARRGAVRPVAWVRLDQPLPDDPPWHAGALTFLSDHVTAAFARQMLAAFTRSTGTPPTGAPSNGALTALNHAVWIHQPFRADQWLLVVRDSPSGTGDRTLTRATFFSPDGRLVASSAQEAAPQIGISTA
ncbi:acyl-CoA thioesterase-2 [Frankia sp. EI5c]|uniref:acyl-CoA thioesterase n=1 Tax=Frankia sp. EI5c TaxID=683316 RepID=UPI0007C3DF31|nr:acyl-CoA thioesterase domain-containing protein [Frankia sp. EI5c]OAA27139.1 acyl-CoA thioesterase-2 [Frankia sp. EI5c]